MAQEDVAKALIDAQGSLYSEEMGAHIEHDTPQELFHWLIGAVMLSARINAGNAVEGARALRKKGLHKIEAILKADRAQIVRVLNRNGYARYDKSTADYIRDNARFVEEEYGGDIRGMRVADPMKAVQRIKGIGPAGAEIFAREVQLVWDELYPVLGKPGAKAATELGLPEEPERLAELAGSRERFVRLVAALTRAALEGPAEQVTAAR
ncbi:hypothetical protein [Pseudoroseicyclus tamaricis]|uniref:Endonuclease III n=1 Tax=Pseudoroseicyclus tamaricis TaxID=2705421 RepID=A0A6B2JZH8_9RHOB|nr:hypothetical protein [Pseudoroseicyclus tamaricis]NDU99525.1 hypothetical protein [Pseudoroseicyclus tamaricis]